MANRNFHKDSGSLERGLVTLYAPISIGVAGAVTLDKKLGVSAVTRTGAGTIEIELDDKYFYMVQANATIVGADQDFTFQVVSDLSATTKVITVTTKVAGTVADLANGTKLKIELVLKNSSVEL